VVVNERGLRVAAAAGGPVASSHFGLLYCLRWNTIVLRPVQEGYPPTAMCTTAMQALGEDEQEESGVLFCFLRIRGTQEGGGKACFRKQSGVMPPPPGSRGVVAC
jgi:hypothetical protein